MGKKILFDNEAKTSLVSGMNKMANAIISTYGPKGRNAAFTQQYDVPLVTNDGYTIAKQIVFEDTFENMGAQIIKEAALKSNKISGDGTTASIVLAQSMINEAFKNIAAGANPVFLRRGMDKAVSVVCDTLSQIAKKDIDNETVYNIATVSGGNDPEIGGIIAEAFDKLGNDCVVLIEDTQMAETVLTVSHGCRLDSGYLSRFFVTDNVKNIGEYNDPYIFVVKDDLTKIKQVYKLLEEAVREDAPIFIIAKDISGECLTALAANAEKDILKVAAVKAPGHGDTRDRNLECIAAVTGATLIDPAVDLHPENCGLSYCGRAKKVVVERNITTIEEPKTPESEKVAELKKAILKRLETEHHLYEVDKLQASLAILNSAMAVISVGGTSELEMFERKYRIEDALNAAKNAVNDGVVPGGGKALLLCTDAVETLESSLDGDEKEGARTIRLALEAPIRQIAKNAGADASVVINKIRTSDSKNFGYDALNDKYGDMFEMKILDPVTVVRNSFVSAESIAAVYVTTGAAVGDAGKPVEG